MYVVLVRAEQILYMVVRCVWFAVIMFIGCLMSLCVEIGCGMMSKYSFWYVVLLYHFLLTGFSYVAFMLSQTSFTSRFLKHCGFAIRHMS